MRFGLRAQLISTYLLLSLVIGVVTLTSTLAVRQVAHAQRLRDVALAGRIEAVGELVSQAADESFVYAVSFDEREKSHFFHALDAIERASGDLVADGVLSSDARLAADEVTLAARALRDRAHGLLDTYDASRVIDQNSYEAYEASFERLHTAAHGLAKAQREESVRNLGAIDRWVSRTVVVIHVFAAVLAVLLGAALGTSLIAPLLRLRDAVVAFGATGEDVALGRLANDEVGDLARTFEVMVESVRARAGMQERIAHLAYHDALTGLPNRRFLEASMSSSNAGAVLLVDLDSFKRVNDAFGHSAGDELVCEVARRITDCVAAGRAPHERALVARLGGDEFVVVDRFITGSTEAAALGAGLLAAISAPFIVREQSVVVTASIGVVLVEEGASAEMLLQRADAAMYSAKAKDKNNVCFHSESIEKARADLAMEDALRNAIENGELEMHFQPKVLAASGKLVGAEALIRWRRRNVGLVGPDLFIPILEETGLIVPVGKWALHEACRRARTWQHSDATRGLTVAVNVSARQFRDPGFVSMVEDVLRETGISPSLLELEVTEGTLMNDTTAARRTLMALKELGVSLALDDFGTGYSSLGYLQRFPFDTLKVDKSFVRDVLVDESSAAITAAIVAMARSLRLAVVAEGVETAEQLAHLRSLGCELVQGFHFSRALPAEGFQAWAEDSHQRASLRAA